MVYARYDHRKLAFGQSKRWNKRRSSNILDSDATITIKDQQRNRKSIDVHGGYLGKGRTLQQTPTLSSKREKNSRKEHPPEGTAGEVAKL